MKRVIVVVAAIVALLGLVRSYNQAFRNNVWQAYVTGVRSELRNLAAAQEGYRSRTGRFAADVAELGDSAFRPTDGVTVRVLVATDSMLRLEGTHRWFAPGAACTLAMGDPGAPSGVRCHGFVDWLYRPRRAR